MQHSTSVRPTAQHWHRELTSTIIIGASTTLFEIIRIGLHKRTERSLFQKVFHEDPEQFDFVESARISGSIAAVCMTNKICLINWEKDDCVELNSVGYWQSILSLSYINLRMSRRHTWSTAWNSPNKHSSAHNTLKTTTRSSSFLSRTSSPQRCPRSP